MVICNCEWSSCLCDDFPVLQFLIITPSNNEFLTNIRITKLKKFLILLLLSSTFAVFESNAQCAMCRRVAQTNYDQQDRVAKAKEMKRGKSLNNGILYLLSVPYLIGSVGVLVWWKNRKKS